MTVIAGKHGAGWERTGKEAGAAGGRCPSHSARKRQSVQITQSHKSRLRKGSAHKRCAEMWAGRWVWVTGIQKPKSGMTSRFRGRLSTDFSCFDSALRSIHGRCGRFADLLGKSGRAAHEAFFPKCFHRFGRDFLKFCDSQKSARVAGPGRAASEFALPHAVAKAVKLSTDFFCFDSALRSIYGRCGRFAEFVGKKGGAWAPCF